MQSRIKTYTWLLAALLLPYVALCFFAHPVADDLTYSYKTMAWGYWQAQQHEFSYWNGRYFSNLILLANPMVWGSIDLYRVAALMLILLIPIVVYLTLSVFFSKEFSQRQRILGALVLSALFLCITPDIAEGIYWYTGAMTYVLACLFTMLYISLVGLYQQQRFIITKTIHWSLLTISLFICLGFNEVNTLLLIAGHVVAILLSYKEKHLRSILFILTGLTVLFSLVMVLAPGNAQRSSFFSNNHQVTHSLYMSCLQVGRFFITWVSSPVLLLASLLFLPLGQKLYEQSPLFQKLTDVKLWKAFIALCAIIFLSVFPAYWGTGILGQHRTLNTACFFFIPAWLCFVFIAAKQFNVLKQVYNPSTKIYHYLTLFFIACMFLLGNGGKALIELGSGEANVYSNEMSQREGILKTTHEKVVAIPTIIHRPTCLFILDISDDPNNGVNRSYEVYYKIDTIQLPHWNL